MLTAVAFVGLAGAGTAIRLLASDHWPGGHRGTLLMNVVGSFLLGLLSGAGAPVPLVVGVGGLGALTTFSTFASDTLALADEGRRIGGCQLACKVVLGLVSSLVGLAFGS